MTSKYGKNKKVAHEAQPSVSLMILPHFEVICDLLLNRSTEMRNLSVIYDKKSELLLMVTSSMRLYFNRS